MFDFFSLEREEGREKEKNIDMREELLYMPRLGIEPTT